MASKELSGKVVLKTMGGLRMRKLDIRFTSIALAWLCVICLSALPVHPSNAPCSPVAEAACCCCSNPKDGACCDAIEECSGCSCVIAPGEPDLVASVPATTVYPSLELPVAPLERADLTWIQPSATPASAYSFQQRGPDPPLLDGASPRAPPCRTIELA